MDVSEAVARRISVRAFTPEPVPKHRVLSLLAKAGQAPSGGNLQPWRVHALTGPPLEELKARATANPAGEAPAYQVYPPGLWDPYRRRRSECGEDLYATIAIARQDRAGRLRQLAENGRLFGAPVGLFVSLDRRLGPPQWADLGIFLQTLMLLAVADGLSTCAQEYWSQYPQTLAELLDLPAEEMVFCGIALGYAAEHPINGLRTRREPLAAWAALHGFD
ncbi:nitroreductase [Chelatococcus reniformis]|uniref:NADH dehydrogenase n=1 Tax=Chelatococcus reniformis TaxID=1494448 RepID=A0A916XRK1_9HYPH|nr:nitroreductase [Chelatococcus reniformis]GGC92713.1 NADH dehydrogenase [Chelatococcus reniformis]